MTSVHYDVLVAGAGPAGSHAARLLAAAGLRVALLDKARFPRDKVCGGGLSAKTLRLLRQVPGAVAHQSFSGAWITWQGRAAIVKDFARTVGCTVVRSEFDHWLVQQAQEAGAEFRPDTPVEQVEAGAEGVEVITGSGRIGGRLLLAADGAGSSIRSQVFGRAAVDLAPALEALVYCRPDRLARFGDRVLFDLGGAPRGYGWIFPKRDHLNAGVYSVFGGGMRAHLQAFLQRHRLLDGATDVRYCGYAIPVRNRTSRYEQGRVWLLGDAAGFAEAVYGEGIYFALASAEVAARVILDAHGFPAAEAYQRAVHARLIPELRWSQRIARLLYSIGSLAFDPLARSERACNWFAGIVTGDVGYRECFWKAAVGAPFWLLSARHPVQAVPH